MKKTLRFLLAFLTAFILMMVVRAIGVTIFAIDGTELEPTFCAGDRVLVNRWSYGLRVGGKDSYFDYGRIARQSVAKGDLVAFENPQNANQVLICRCAALPGDSVRHEGQTLIVPSLKDCADADYYWMMGDNRHNSADSRYWGFVPEDHIVGKPIFIWFSSDPDRHGFSGVRWNRLFRFVDNIK